MKKTCIYLIALFAFGLAQAQSLESHYTHKSHIDLALSSKITDQSGFDVRELLLELEVTNQSTSLKGSASLWIDITDQSFSTFTLELVEKLQVSSVLINSINTNFTHQNEQLIIQKPTGLSNSAIIKVSYSGTPNPASDGIFTGINTVVSNAWGNQITYTLSEPFNAKSWWPSKQDLKDKIDRSRLHIITSSNLKVGSNGLLKKSVAIAGNRIRYEWETNYPMAYYLVAFSVGEYVEFSNYAKPTELNGDSILIQNYIYNNPNTLPYYQESLDRMPKLVELFSDLFGLYPFHEEKYGHMMAPFSGGMEHQTMSSMGIFTFGLDAHELGHQWFGNHVTCATWNDIWINEGFARFCEYIATERILSLKNARAIMEDDMLGVTGTPNGSVYIPLDEALTDKRIFQYRLTYLKGGLIINMIREIINDDAVFFAMMRTYLSEYGNSTATGENFKKVLERETKLDFNDFFEQWYYGGGFPLFDITWTKLAGDTLGIHIIQQTTDNVALFTTPLEFRIKFESGQVKNFKLQQSENDQFFKIPALGKVQILTFDPDKWLIKKMIGYVQLDENGKPILGLDPNTKLDIYPNPANEIITLPDGTTYYEIHDTSGRLIIQSSLTDGSTIDIKTLKPGLYHIQALVNRNKRVAKLLKQ
jgi:aminopeptidase N